MKILAVDTTSQFLGLALQDGARLWRRRLCAPGVHDAKLFPALKRLLKIAGLKLKDLDALAAASGPGSFTGIRVGMTFVSILAAALERPAVAVTWFEASAHRAAAALKHAEEKVLGVVYPGPREELFFQAFRLSDGRPEPLREPRWAARPDWPRVFAEETRRRKTVLAGPAAAHAAGNLGAGKRNVRVWEGPASGAADLIPPALERLGRGAPGEFLPLYLKPAYYEK